MVAELLLNRRHSARERSGVADEGCNMPASETLGDGVAPDQDVRQCELIHSLRVEKHR